MNFNNQYNQIIHNESYEAMKALMLAGIITGAPLSQAAGTVVNKPVSSQFQKTPRGVRNNNPGNIKKSRDNWQGSIGTDGVFVKFNTMENGIRALARTLKTYQNSHNCKSIRQIITRWAPPEDNNPTAKYINFISKNTGIDPDTPLNFNRDEIALIEVIKNIIKFENGIDVNTLTIIKGIRAEEK